MKAVLIVPSPRNNKLYKEYPLGAAAIGTALRLAGVETTLLDQALEDLSDAQVIDKVYQQKPDMVGFSIVTPTYPSALLQMRALKTAGLAALMAAGGVHPTIFPRMTIDDGFDLVLTGEGERSIVDFAEGQSYDRIGGLAYKDSHGFHLNPSGTPLELDQLAQVDRSFFDPSLYTHHTVSITRGCPFRCKFCCDLFRGQKRRVRRLEALMEELHGLGGQSSETKVFFADDIFMGSAENILGFCAAYRHNNFRFEWVAQVRADTVTELIARAMKECGCSRVYIGVESGSDDILRACGKGVNSARTAQAIEVAKNSGLTVKTGWIYGLPGSMEEQKKSIPLMLKSRPHQISIHQFVPFPGTEYYRDASKYGIRFINKYDFSSFAYSGISDNFIYNYLSRANLEDLFHETAIALEKEGYIPSDQAGPDDEFIYTTPLQQRHIRVFNE